MEKVRFNLVKPEHLSAVLSLMTELQKHSNETFLHSVDVADRALTIALDFDLTDEEVSRLYTAALLHDIGKLFIDPELLHKKANETEKEYIQKRHIEATRQILEEFFDEDIISVACHHHERLNCSGYPENLNATKLDILDRILQAADVTSALLLNRSYQDARLPEETLEILKNLVRRGELDKKCVNEIEKLYLQSKDPDQPQ